jgi:uncharacterized protein (TIGR02271 family)
MKTVRVLRWRSSAAGWCLAGSFLTAQAVAAEQPIPPKSPPAVRLAPPIYVGDEKIRTTAFIERGRLFVPVRGVFEAIGASVSFSTPHFVVVRKGEAVIAAFIVDRPHAIVGRRSVQLDAPPTRRHGRIYVPLRVVAEAAGAGVSYAGTPRAVHITPAARLVHAPLAANSAAFASAPVPSSATPSDADAPSTARWRVGIALVTALGCLGCLALTVRRFGPSFMAAAARSPAIASRSPEQKRLPRPPADHVALTKVEANGEASFRREFVTETRTINVPVTREELVIEFAGEGGTVIIDGRELSAGETIRIPLWEERVHVDVTRHVLISEDIIAGRRRTPPSLPSTEAAANDFTLIEGSPS